MIAYQHDAFNCRGGGFDCFFMSERGLSLYSIMSIPFLPLLHGHIFSYLFVPNPFFVNNFEKTYEMLPMLLDQRWPPLFSISYQMIIFNDGTSYVQPLGGQGQRRMPHKSTFCLLKVAYCRGDGYSFFWFRRGVFIRGFCQQVLSV